jgi:hypothetical protein
MKTGPRIVYAILSNDPTWMTPALPRKEVSPGEGPSPARRTRALPRKTPDKAWMDPGTMERTAKRPKQLGDDNVDACHGSDG